MIERSSRPFQKRQLPSHNLKNIGVTVLHLTTKANIQIAHPLRKTETDRKGLGTFESEKALMRHPAEGHGEGKKAENMSER
jgi:hypothetical protein